MVKKILIIALAVLVVALIALTVLVKVYITPESVKAFIIPEAERALNRKVHLGGVDISLFNGIRVRDFAIMESDGATDFLSAEEFVLKYRFLPLLTRRVVIEELSLDTPRIRIVRDSNGMFNFEDIGQKEEASREDVRKETESGGLPISLLVDNIVVRDASFSMRDHTKELPDTRGGVDVEMGIQSVSASEIASRGSLRLRLDEIILKDRPEVPLTGVTASLVYAISVATQSRDIRIEKADLTVQEVPLSFSGTLINLKVSPEIDLAVSLADAQASDIEKTIALFTDTGGLNLIGSLSSDLKVTGQPKQPDTLKVLADISLNKIGATYKAIPLSLDGSLQADITTQKVHIRKSDLNLLDIPLSVTGTVTGLNASPALDISLSLPEAKTANMQKAISSLSGIQDINLTGAFSADLKVTGMPKKIETLQTNGKVTLNDLGALYGDISTKLNGTLNFRGQSVDIRTMVQSGNNSAEISGAVESYLKKPAININLYSERLSIDEIIPAGRAEGKTTTEKDTSPSKKRRAEPEPLDLGLSAQGEIKIDTALYRNMEMNDLYASYLLKDNRFEIKKLSAGVGKGRLGLNSMMDLSKPGYRYSLSCSLDSLHAEELVNAFVPKAMDTVFGILSLDISMNGNGMLPENMKKNLRGNGAFTIQDGKITNSRLPEQLALFLGIEELKTIHIRKADGTVNIGDGSARLNSLFASDDITMDPSGTIGLDETLDLAFDLKLSPDLTGKVTMNSNIAQYVQDEKGWGSIPLKVSGTFSDPSYTVDVAKAGKRVIKKEAGKVIDKLFDQKDEKKQKQMAPVKDLLKGILQE